MTDANQTAELRPCPFCGEAAGGVFEHGGPNDHWVVECSACRGEYSEEGREAAIAGWNRRASTDNQTTDRLFAEDPDERRIFDGAVRRHGGPLRAMAHSFAVMRLAFPETGDIQKTMMIYSNECHRAADRAGEKADEYRIYAPFARRAIDNEPI